MKSNILQKNKESWDIVAPHFNGVDALPSYGPFAQTEEELQLFGEIANKKVLDIGCGSGHSLKYMAEYKASELWGVDLSETQVKIAKQTLEHHAAHLYCAPMEEEIGLPREYFDIVYSIYAIGWATDLAQTFQLIHSYLKHGGTFIFSWDHPLYAVLKSESGQFILADSYQQENTVTYKRFKGEDAPMTIHKRKLSTYINELIKAGFAIESVIESDVGAHYGNDEGEVSDRYYSLYKARMFPSTMIIKARKLKF